MHASSLSACAAPHPQILFIRPDAGASSGILDQKAITKFSKLIHANLTIVSEVDLDRVAKDPSRTGYLAGLQANMLEMERRVKKGHLSDSELDGLFDQRERLRVEMKSLQPDRASALRSALKSTLLKIPSGQNTWVVFSGHGQRCSGTDAATPLWCADLGNGQSVTEKEIASLTKASLMILDSAATSSQMDILRSEPRHLLACTQGEFVAEDSGQGLLITALDRLQEGRPDELCAMDHNHDGQISFEDFANFVAAAHHPPAVKGATNAPAPTSTPPPLSVKPNGSNEVCLFRYPAQICRVRKLNGNYARFNRLFKHPEVPKR